MECECQACCQSRLHKRIDALDRELKEVQRLQTKLLDLWLQKENAIKPKGKCIVIQCAD